MTIEGYSVSQFVNDLRQISRETVDHTTIINRVRPLAKRLALDRAWLQDTFYQASSEQGFGVHLIHEEEDHTLAVFAVSWLRRYLRAQDIERSQTRPPAGGAADEV